MYYIHPYYYLTMKWKRERFSWADSHVAKSQRLPWNFKPGEFLQQKRMRIHMSVSENSVTPKSSILIGFSIINHPFWGTTIFGNTYINSCLNVVWPTTDAWDERYIYLHEKTLKKSTIHGGKYTKKMDPMGMAISKPPLQTPILDPCFQNTSMDVLQHFPRSIPWLFEHSS